MFLLLITLFGQFKLEKCFSGLTSSSQNLLLQNVTAFLSSCSFFNFVDLWNPSCLFLSVFSFFAFLYTHYWFTCNKASALFTWAALASACAKLLLFGHAEKDDIKERKNCYSKYHLPTRLQISRKITIQVEGKTTEKTRKVSETI